MDLQQISKFGSHSHTLRSFSINSRKTCPVAVLSFVMLLTMVSIVGRRTAVPLFAFVTSALEKIAMAKFLFVYHSEPFDISKNSPEQMQQMMAQWTKWIQQGFTEGWLLDAGDALGPDGRVVKNGQVTDGPFIESKELVGGYSVIEAPSFDAAVAHAKACPGSTDGGSVEIRPLAGLSAAG